MKRDLRCRLVFAALLGELLLLRLLLLVVGLVGGLLALGSLGLRGLLLLGLSVLAAMSLGNLDLDVGAVSGAAGAARSVRVLATGAA